MERNDRGSHGDHARVSASSFSASLPALQAVVRKAGYALERLLQLVHTKVTSDEDLELALQLQDELKPLIDALVHFEVPSGS